MFLTVFRRFSSLRIAFCLALLGVGCTGKLCSATISFELPELVVAGDGSTATSGAFEVLVRADVEDLPQQVASLNLHLSVDSPLVSLGPVTSPESAPLLVGGSGLLDFSPDPQTVQVAHDVFPGSAALADQLSLVRVPFEVASGALGTFELSFLAFNELADESSIPLSILFVDTGSITVTDSLPTLPGDFNEDGDVDGGDFLAWQIGFETLSGATLADGDANADGVVNSLDLELWKDHYSSREHTIAVLTTPEPTGSTLALVGGALWLCGIARCSSRTLTL